MKEVANKIINRIKEKDNILVFVLFFVVSAGISLNIYLESGDELWNFQNVYKMYKGYKIYEEINVIITPLSYWIEKATFQIVGANLFVFRVSHCIIISTLLLFTYIILKKLNVSKTVSLLTAIIINLQEFFLLIRTSWCYNNMALMLFVIGVYYIINEKTRKNLYIQAIITILIILTKQNIGIYYLLGNIVYLCALENNIKHKIKDIVKYISVLLLGGIAFIIYMINDNNLYNFINYTFGGILEFASENGNYEISSIIYIIGIIILNIVISIVLLQKKILSEKQKENVKILLIFSMMLAIVCYPIFNSTHIIIATYLMMINTVYILYILFKDFRDGFQKILKIVNTISITAMMLFSIFNINIFWNNITSEDYQYSWEDPFFGGVLGKEEYEKNQEIINYIEENDKNVIVFSHMAAFYMIPLERNNGDFDLPFKGNLGIKGEESLLERVANIENTQFLLYKKEKCYQESEKVEEYIKNNKRFIGEIWDFEIYE